MVNEIKNAAEHLEGCKLANGWTVVERVQADAAQTGGTFSIGYIVENEAGHRAFLKALDYSRALDTPNRVENLQLMTTMYRFEKDILERCRERRMSRVVRLIDDGHHQVLGATAPLDKVDYIIFELADCDARSYVDFSRQLDVA